MGKQGPCHHCGVTSTPLWRNGPPEKPVLCNACGSRWRTKGTLANYTPLHARPELDNFEDQRVSRVKIMSINKTKEEKLLKRKPTYENGVVGGVVTDYNLGYRKVLDEDISNRSSSGSAISNSESCVQFCSTDASDLTDPPQSVVWDSMVPSKKRTCVNRPKPSSVEKLTKDLYAILHEQQSSCWSLTSEEELIFKSETPMVSVEIGHGSVLIRHPSSIARDEESEASSLSFENKTYSITEAYSHSTNHSYNESQGVKISSAIGKSNNSSGQWLQHEQVKREKVQQEKIHVLRNPNSPLCNINLNDIVNFDEFVRSLTNEEQQQLFKYLPPLDTARLPDSLRDMFESSQFKENISLYQQLLAEGVFDHSFVGAKTDDCKTLSRMTLSNLLKSEWVECYHLLKKLPGNSASSQSNGASSSIGALVNVVNPKRSRDNLALKVSEMNSMKSPKRMTIKAANDSKELMENDGSCYSPRRLFSVPSDGGSLMLDALHFIDETPDQDVLLDVPSNGMFPQAELLKPTISFQQQLSSINLQLLNP